MNKRKFTAADEPIVAVAYARYSSHNQRVESIDAQIRAINEYCEKNYITLLEVFTDEAQTGKNDNRDNFQIMINEILKGRIKCNTILVHKFNRFARNKFDSAIYKKRLKDIGVRVVSVTQHIENTPEGALLEGFLEVLDEYYSANLALEVKKGLRENALNGKHAGGQVPLGLSLNDGYYIKNENAEIVKRIFEEYAAGVPKLEICRRINAEGFINQRGKTLNVRTVYDMLRNEKYIGNYVYTIDGRETIRLNGIIPHIIDRELWDRVQKINNEPVKKKNGAKKREYFLTGKTFCECCGFQICGGGSKRSRNGELIYYYRCVGKEKHKNGCKNPALNKSYFENNVLKSVVNAVFNDDNLKLIAGLVFAEIELMKKPQKVSSDTLRAELIALEKKQDRLTELYLDGEFNKKKLDEKNAKISARVNEIEIELTKRKAVDEINDVKENIIFDYLKEYIQTIINNNANDEDEFMRAVFNAFIDKITVNEKTVNVAINAAFSLFEIVGGKRNLSGVIRRIAPIKLKTDFTRKKQFSKV